MSNALQETFAQIHQLTESLNAVIMGNARSVQLLICSFLAGGHALIEDRPGVGKTALARALAKGLSCNFNRVQFTPDLMPGDITGSMVWRPQDGELVFRKGPIFTHILLGDELNRASPRVQSALLEAMNEFHVSVDSKTHLLPDPFFFVATQNPYEDAGCHPLPEAQLDRFMVKLDMACPDPETELKLLLSRSHGDPIQQMKAVLSVEETKQLRSIVPTVKLETSLLQWLIQYANLSRQDTNVLRGLSPRALIQMISLVKAWALSKDRHWVEPDDFSELLIPAFAHRLSPKGYKEGQGRNSAQIAMLENWLDECPLPH